MLFYPNFQKYLVKFLFIVNNEAITEAFSSTNQNLFSLHVKKWYIYFVFSDSTIKTADKIETVH